MNSNFTPEHSSLPQQIHLTDYLNILRRRKWVVIIFFIVVVSIVTVTSFKCTAIYKATTQIIIERQSSPLINLEGVLSNDNREQDFYQTQYNLLQSRSLARKVIENLELWKVFAEEKEKSNLLAMGSNVTRDSINSSDTNTSKTESEPLNEQVEPVIPDNNLIVDWYLANLEIAPVRGSRLVNISFFGSSPEMTARVVTAHARAFIDKNLHIQHSVSQQALNWLKMQLQEQKAKVEASQREIYEYKKLHNIISLPEERQNIVTQKLMDLNSTLTKAKAERIAKQTVYEQLKSFSIDSEALFSLPEISQDPVIQNLRNELIQLKAKQIKYEPNHPTMIELNSDINYFEKQITGEVQRIRKAIKLEVDRAVAVEESIQKTLDDQKQVALSTNEKAINYDVLQQEAESNQHLYNILLKQVKEINLTSALESSNIRIVDEAEVPLFPVEPRIFLYIFLSIVLSMFMGTGLAFFFEYMDNTVKTSEDVQQRLGMSVLGTIPYDKSLKSDKTLALSYGKSITKQKKHAERYAFDISNRFITSLRLRQREKHGHVLLIESATSGEGKTTTLAKSAISLARRGLRVLMVDADVQRPALHNLFGFKSDRERGLITAMTRVLSRDIHAGSLSEYSVDDLFTLIDFKKQTGQLFITSNSYEMTAVFKNGCLLHIQSKNNPLANRLGNMLLCGGFITKGQLQDALERNKRTGQPLGYIFINAGYLTQDQLQGPLKLQIEEHLQKIFSWKDGTFVFEPGSVETYEDQRIYFEEDYTPIIRRLGRTTGSRLLVSEVLSYIKPLNEPNLSLLPVGTASTKPNDQVYFMLLEKFLDILKQRFDLILVDAPPLLDIGDATPLSTLADGVLFVVKAGHLPVKIINEATASLKEAKANILGTVLNQAKIDKNYYYYQ